MRNRMFAGAVVALAAGWQTAHAQPPGGAEGPDGLTLPTFADLNSEIDESPEHITREEFTAWFRERFAGRSPGGPGESGGPGGQPGGAGGPPPGPGGAPGGFGPEGMFSRWDENDDGLVSRAEFDNRQRGFGGQGGPGTPPDPDNAAAPRAPD